MKIILFFLSFAAIFSAGSQQVFHDADAQVRNVGPFTGIDVSSAIDLQLSQGNEDAVAVSTGNQSNTDAIKTEVRNGVLKIWYEQKNWFKNRGRARAYVSVKALNGITASGASEVTINGVLNSSSLSVRMSGASDLQGNVKASSLNINLSGASDVNLRGSAENIKVDASGASHLKGYEFVAENCRVKASGASDVKLTSNKVIDAEASGASNIFYKGSAQEGKIRSSGASSISKRG